MGGIIIKVEVVPRPSLTATSLLEVRFYDTRETNGPHCTAHLAVCALATGPLRSLVGECKTHKPRCRPSVRSPARLKARAQMN